MRWYVNRNGETVGPVDEAQLTAWIQSGMVDAQIQPETGGPWMPVMQTNFARLVAPPRKRPTALWVGLGAAAAVVLGALVVCGLIARSGSSGPQTEAEKQANRERILRERDETERRHQAEVEARAAASRKPTATEVPLSALLADYKDNEVRADSLYKGKRLRVTGKAGAIKKGLLNQMYITLGTGAAFEIPQAQCFFDESYAQRVASISKGDSVTVECDCDGLMMNVLMKDCYFD